VSTNIPNGNAVTYVKKEMTGVWMRGTAYLPVAAGPISKGFRLCRGSGELLVKSTVPVASMIYRSPFPSHPRDLATKRKLRDFMATQQNKMDVQPQDNVPSDPAFQLGQGRRDAINKRLQDLYARKKTLLVKLKASQTTENQA